MSAKSNLITDDLAALQHYQADQSEATERDRRDFVGLGRAIVGVLDYFGDTDDPPPEIRRLRKAARKLMILDGQK